MRLFASTFLALGLATAAQAQTALSDEIGTAGLRATEARLAALPSPTPDELFALGGVRFLGGIERALQLRYRVGLSDGLAVMSGIPVLRLPIGENPAPEPFEPVMIAELFEGIEADMAGAIASLDAIADDAAVGVAIDTSDLWFDIDANGLRAPGEGVMEIAGFALSGGFLMEDMPSATIRFDTADARWLSAYAHLLSGISNGILATDPTEAVARVTASRAAFAELGLPGPTNDFTLANQFSDTMDVAAMFVLAAEGPLDPARTQALRDHLLACIEDNRAFWTLVAREGDNDLEWIPNKNQQSATGLPFPPDTGTLWLAVLSDAEKVLRGELLIPYWRLGEGAGFDLAAFLQDPPVVDLAGLIQGSGLLPYLRQGPLADGRALWTFTSLLQGDSGLYMVMLN
jgi:hypothetical protein